MTLPYERNRDFVDQSGPEIDHDTLNDLQDDDVDFWRMTTGEDYVKWDDFDGGAVDTNKWAVPSGGGFTVPTLVTDAGSPWAYGALELSAPIANPDSQLNTASNLGVRTKDYRCLALVRITAVGGAGSTFIMQAPGSDVGALAMFRAKQGSSNWWAVDDFASPGVAAETDLGVAYATTAAYDKIEIRRTSGVYEWWVNGVLLRSQTPAAVPTATGGFSIASHAGTSGTQTARVDKVAIWIRR